MDLIKSDFEYSCPPCNNQFVTNCDKVFKKHIENSHPPFKNFKNNFGPCEKLVRGTGTFQCVECRVVLSHRSSAIDR